MSPAPTDEAVASAETELGARLPPTYVAFLRRAEPIQLPPHAQFYRVTGETNIVAANCSEREKSSSPVPEFLIAFYTDGMGNQLCFDTSKGREDGEFPVVFWDHELTAGENLEMAACRAAGMENAGIVAEDFATWLDWLVRTYG